MASWIAQNIKKPEYIVSSPAKRASQTVMEISSAFGLNEQNIQFDEDVYLASLPTLLSVISSIPDTYSSAMLVGHNPGLENLLLYLSKDIPPYTSEGKLFTTANVAVLNCINTELPRFEEKSYHLESLTRPSDVS